MKRFFFILLTLSIVIFAVYFNFYYMNKKLPLPEYIYAAGPNKELILKIDPAKQKGEVISKSKPSEGHVAWIFGSLVYLPGNKLMITGNDRSGYFTAIIDIKSKSVVNRIKVDRALHFPKYNSFIFLKDEGVYLSKSLDDMTGAERLADEAGYYQPFLVKMTGDEFGFWGYGADGKAVFSVYDFRTKKIREVPELIKNQTHQVYRSKTNEFFIDKEVQGKWQFIVTDGQGNQRPGPECITKLSPYNELLYYDEKFDQLYFNSGYFRFFDLQHGPHEDKDLYVYDFATDRCVKVYESLYATSMISSSEIEAIDAMTENENK